jgi:hypothetical protein
MLTVPTLVQVDAVTNLSILYISVGSLCICRTLPEKKKPVSSLENSPLCGNLNFAGATLSGMLLLQRDIELRWSSLTFSRCSPEPPCAEMTLYKGAPSVYYHHTGTYFSAENPSFDSNPA